MENLRRIHTDAPSIKHQVARFQIIETPKDGRSAKYNDAKEYIENLYRTFGQYRVVKSCGPQILVSYW
jgi:hypothetical protein